MKPGILVISHGSREAEWVRLVDEAVADVAAAFVNWPIGGGCNSGVGDGASGSAGANKIAGASARTSENASVRANANADANIVASSITDASTRVSANVPVISSFLEIVDGRLIQDGIDQLAAEGVTDVYVLPLFVSSGSTHVDDIAQAFGLPPVSASRKGELESFRLGDNRTSMKSSAVSMESGVESRTDSTTDSNTDTNAESNVDSSTDSNVNSNVGSSTESNVNSSTDSNTESSANSSTKIVTKSDTDSGDGSAFRDGSEASGSSDASQRLRIHFGQPIDDDPEIAELLLSNIRELSQAPERERLLLVAHGSVEAGFYGRWRSGMMGLARRLHELGGYAGAEIAMLLPNQAACKLRVMLRKQPEQAVIVVPLFLSTGYFTRTVIPARFGELAYRYNGRSMLPHPCITRWMNRQIEAWLDGFIV